MRDKRVSEHSSNMLKDLEQEHSKQQEKLHRGTSPRSQHESGELSLTPHSQTLPAGSRGQSRADADGWSREVPSHAGSPQAEGKVQI